MSIFWAIHLCTHFTCCCWTLRTCWKFERCLRSDKSSESNLSWPSAATDQLPARFLLLVPLESYCVVRSSHPLSWWDVAGSSRGPGNISGVQSADAAGVVDFLLFGFDPRLIASPWPLSENSPGFPKDPAMRAFLARAVFSALKRIKKLDPSFWLLPYGAESFFLRSI